MLINFRSPSLHLLGCESNINNCVVSLHALELTQYIAIRGFIGLVTFLKFFFSRFGLLVWHRR